MRKFITASIVAFLASGLPGLSSSGARAADLQVIAVPPIKDSVSEVARKLEAASGQKLDMRIASGGDVLKMAIASPFDIAFVPPLILKEPAAAAVFRIGSVVGIGSTELGVTVRAGAAKPEVSTPEALKQTLLKARTFGIVPSAAVASQVAQLFDKLEIGQAMKAKLVDHGIVDEVIRDLAAGDIEITILPINVIVGARGIELIAPLPAPLKQAVPVVAALPLKDGPNPEGARALIALFKSPEGAAVLKSKGLTPD